jgi:hypothetical protein
MRLRYAKPLCVRIALWSAWLIFIWHALNLKEPYKSLPTSSNNSSNIANRKQDNLLFTSPLLKDASNNITIDLSSYVLKTNFDSSFNNIKNTKQDNLLFTSPLSKAVSNNLTIDLSAYPLKTNVDSSLNNIINTKQDNLWHLVFIPHHICLMIEHQ